MKRHPGLVPLSHDHHEALVAARRLQRGADEPNPTIAAAAFLDFFATSAVPHFRTEEELLFPRAIDAAAARELIVEALVEHQQLHAAATRLGQLIADADGERLLEAMRELASLLGAHVRFEERRLFPLLEELLPEEALGLLGAPSVAATSGPIWGAQSEDLNATLLSWRAGEGSAEHVNEERDVLLVVLTGSVTLTVEGVEHELVTGETTIIGKGQRRKIKAGPGGVRYLSVHRRRPPLQIARAKRSR